jgi:hypothetical protein
MRLIAGTLGVLMLVTGARAAQDNAGTDAAAARELIAQERALYGAVASGDRAAFDALVLPDGTWTTGSGFVPMRLLAGALSSFELPQWDIVNPHVTRTGSDAAVVLYSRSGGGRYAGQPLAALTLASTVWTRRDGKWLAVHHQETDLTQ